MAEEEYISVTARQNFKWCRRNWHYARVLRLVPITTAVNSAFIGTGIHAALAEHYKHRNDPIAAFSTWLDEAIPPEEYSKMYPEEQLKVDGVRQLGIAMLENYLSFAADNDDFEVLEVEKPFVVRIPKTRIFLKGIIDLLVRVKNKLWVIDHKTLETFVKPEVLERDDQMACYLWVVKQTYNENPGGAIYNQIRRKIPVEPMLLKSGAALSRDKQIDTTYDIYMAAIQKHGFDPADYVDILTDIQGRGFVKRELIARSTQSLLRLGNQLKLESRDMKRKNVYIYPNQTKDCVWKCSYTALCRCEDDGGDVEAMIAANFKTSNRV